MTQEPIPKSKTLVIDDGQSILNLAAVYLQNEGYDYLSAIDGLSGLKAASLY